MYLQQSFIQKSEHINKFKDTVSNNLRAFKSNIDFFSKAFSEVKSSVENFNVKEKCSELIEVFQSNVKFQLIENEVEIKAIKINNEKYHLEAMKKCVELSRYIDKFKEFNASEQKRHEEILFTINNMYSEDIKTIHNDITIINTELNVICKLNFRS